MTLKSPRPVEFTFDEVIPYPVLSRKILPHYLLTLAITHLITKIFSEH